MLRTIIRLRGVLPARLWQQCWDVYWRYFWSREETEEARELGHPPLAPIAGSERAVLAEQIAEHYPFSSFLEVGCAYGQNFAVIAKQYPNVSFLGVDKNASRVTAGQESLRKRGIKNVILKEGCGESLSEFEDNRFDLVICCAVLLYVGPNRVEQVVREMLRVAKRCILIMEQHAENPKNKEQDLGSFVPLQSGDSGYWLRDYRLLLKRFVSEENMRLTAVPFPRWEQEQWKKYAHLLEVSLN